VRGAADIGPDDVIDRIRIAGAASFVAEVTPMEFRLSSTEPLY